MATAKQTWTRLQCLLALGACLLAAQSARAFVLIPITMDFDPAGRGTNRTFRVENDSDSPVAVQVSMVTREMDEEGKETTAPADEDFSIYPPQIALGPKQNQAVRISWNGRVKPTEEVAFRIVAEQLPVNLTAEQASGGKINLVVRYLGTVYIVPKGAKADIVLESVTTAKGEDGAKQLAVTLNNRGSAHGLLHNVKMTVTAGGTTVELTPDQLRGLTGENVLGHHKRRFLLAWPEGLGDGTPKATLDFMPIR